ncbi:hypothetical protein P9112_006029 [Eukaryota sp. TZLM1-RC]
MKNLIVVFLVLVAVVQCTDELTLTKTARPTSTKVASSGKDTFTEVCLTVKGFGEVKKDPKDPPKPPKDPKPPVKCQDPLHVVIAVEESQEMQRVDASRQRIHVAKSLVREMRPQCDWVVIVTYDRQLKETTHRMTPSQAISHLSRISARSSHSDSSISAALQGIKLGTSRLGSARRMKIVVLGTGKGTYSTSTISQAWPIYSIGIGYSKGAAHMSNLRFLASYTGGAAYTSTSERTIGYLKSHLCFTSVTPPSKPDPKPDQPKPSITAPYDINVFEGTKKFWISHKEFHPVPDAKQQTKDGFTIEWHDVGPSKIDGKSYLTKGETLKFCFKTESKLPGKCPVDVVDYSRVEYKVKGKKVTQKFPQAYVTVSDAPIKCPSEKDVLIDFYQKTGGEQWKEDHGWLEGEPCHDGKYPENKWFGVHCSDNKVKELRLPNNNLVGELPSTIGCLSFLKDLHLPGNKLTGPLPASIGQLIHLQYFDLSDNMLSGGESCDGKEQTIPSNVCMLKHLKYFYLSRNPLTGVIPSCVGKMKELDQWHTDCSKLKSEIPKGFLSLPLLTELHTFCSEHEPDCPPWKAELEEKGVIFKCESVDCRERCQPKSY